MGTELIALEGNWKLEGYALGRLPNEVEYIKPRGGSLIIPTRVVQPAIDLGVRFNGYLLRDCRYVRTIGRKTWEDEFPNLIPNEGLTGIAKMLIDSSAAYDTGIKRMEIGTGGGSAITPTVDDTSMVGGAVRFATSAPTQSAGVITVVTVTTTAGGNNIFWREVGLYIANDTSTLAAGDLLSHASVSRDNTGGGDVTATATIALTRKTSA